jgi:hypothetical protein
LVHEIILRYSDLYGSAAVYMGQEMNPQTLFKFILTQAKRMLRVLDEFFLSICTDP